MAKSGNRILVKNSAMLMAMNAAKILFPLITLPYLTRVLSKPCYGVTVYVKSVMTYMQLIVDFGFMLSATKGIVNAAGDRDQEHRVIRTVLSAKLLLAAAAFGVLLILSLTLPLLRENRLFTLLSFVPIALSVFLMDFLFRGLERMEVVAGRFVIMRGIATALTFVFVRSDVDLLWIPALDTFGTLVAIGMIFTQIRRLGYQISFRAPFSDVWSSLKDSAVYFASSMASTSFNALNTILLGIMLSAEDVAYWGVCMQAVAAIQALYTPITESLYPVMIKEKSLRRIRSMVKLFLPLVFIGCAAAWLLSDFGITLIGGKAYLPAADLFRKLVPLLFFSFFSVLFGWPTLGAVDLNAETSRTTVSAVLFQISGLVLLILFHIYSLTSIAVVRDLSEAVLFGLRFRCFWRNRWRFSDYEGVHP